MMSLLRIFHVSGSAVSAQSQRLNTVSSNLANADTAAGPDGKSFKARQVVFQTLPMSDDASSVGVKVSAVREDDTPGRRIHDPAWDALFAPIEHAVSFAAGLLNRFQFLTIRRYLGLVFGLLVVLLAVVGLSP